MLKEAVVGVSFLGLGACSGVPFQPSQSYDSEGSSWSEVVRIRQQKLAEAHAAVEASCKRARSDIKWL